MKIIQTDNMSPSGTTEGLWIYNGLDCCVTLEVLNVTETLLDNTTRGTYEFSKSLQGPILEMNMRGVKVDLPERARLLTAYETDLARLAGQLDRILHEGYGVILNWRSPKQLIEFFYGTLSLPEIRKRNQKGQMVPTINREALEKLSSYFTAQPVVSHLLKMRDIAKKVGVLRTNIDTDGRMRTSYNIAGTTTGRLSSALSDFGTGTNLQNIEQRLRRVFIPDPQLKFANADLSQADARWVGAILWNLFSDGTYLDACESGDLHTTVCRMAWSDLAWTGDPKSDRAIADRPAYRDMSYRDLAKRLGHGTNYLGMPATMAKHSKLPRDLIEDFQKRYFNAFPTIREWHNWVRAQLLQHGYITTIFNRKRWFFGRRNDDAVVREAVAFEPQSCTSDLINMGLLNIWRQGIAQPLLQVHDSILVQYPEELEFEVAPRVIAALEIPVELAKGRKFVIPSDAKVGWNWSDYSSSNPSGLMKWTGKKDERTRPSTETSVLDRSISAIHGRPSFT